MARGISQNVEYVPSKSFNLDYINSDEEYAMVEAIPSHEAKVLEEDDL